MRQARARTGIGKPPSRPHRRNALESFDLPADPYYAEIAEEHGLPALEDKQHQFVVNILSGMTCDQAWLKSGYCTTGLSKFSIHGRAVRLRRNPDIVVWINAARMADCEQANYTLSQHVAELDEIKQQSLAMGVPGAAAQCAIHKGKALGYYTDRIKLEESPDPKEVIAQLREAMGPEIANAFAAKLLRTPHEDHEDYDSGEVSG